MSDSECKDELRQKILADRQMRRDTSNSSLPQKSPEKTMKKVDSDVLVPPEGFGSAIVTKTFDINKEDIEKIKRTYFENLNLFITEEVVQDEDDEVDYLGYETYQALRKGSAEENFRRRSVSLPENIMAARPKSEYLSRPVKGQGSFARSNSLPLITEFGRLVSFPSEELLRNLPPSVYKRVEGVNIRHDFVMKKKMQMLARIKAAKDMKTKNSQRIPYFRNCAERVKFLEKPVSIKNEALDCFPTMLVSAGFTGVTFTDNSDGWRELGKLCSYPTGKLALSEEVERRRDICESRRLFAKRKKAKLLQRGVELKKRKEKLIGSPPVVPIITTEAKVWKEEKKMKHDSSHASLASRISIEIDDEKDDIDNDVQPPQSLKKSLSEESFHEIEEKKAPFIDVAIQRRNSLSIVDERVLNHLNSMEPSVPIPELPVEIPLTTLEKKPSGSWKSASQKRRSSFSVLEWKSSDVPPKISTPSKSSNKLEYMPPLSEEEPANFDSSHSEKPSYFQRNQGRRDSLTVKSADELRSIAEVTPADDIIKQIQEVHITTPKEEKRGTWTIAPPKALPISSIDQYYQIASSFNPLFDVSQIDFSRTTKEDEQEFKRKFTALSSSYDDTSLSKTVHLF